jgi:predicted nucleotidyltransferase
VSLNSLQVLAYFAVFRYPLTKKEIACYTKHVSGTGTKFHTLKNITPINRLRRNKTSRQKTFFARKITQSLTKIPFIQFIGLTGAIAANNAKPNDDIDLLIVTRSNTLWFSRLIVNLYLNLKNLRRKPNSSLIKNKLCLNLWLDQQALKLPQSHQNIYSAFELTLQSQFIKKVFF